MKQKILLRTLCLLLAFIIGFSSLPIENAFAMSQNNLENDFEGTEVFEDNSAEAYMKEKNPAQLQAELDDMVYEIKSLREENVKHFRLADGTYQAVAYGQPVHRKNADGVWVDIDNSLSVEGEEIATNNARVKFAKKITGNGNIFTLHEGNHKVTFGLRGANKKIEGNYVNTATDFDESVGTLQRLTTLDKLSARVIYEDILSGVDIEYILEANDIKENIIIKDMTDTYSYTFEVKLNGLEAKLDNNSVAIYDVSTGKEFYRIPAPFMYDAMGEMSTDVHYDLTETDNGKYELQVVADEQWINANDRVFPVVIDPTLVDVAQVADTYVSYSDPTVNYGLSSYLLVSGYHEAYYKFTTPTLPNGVTVSYATVKIPYYYFVTNEKYMSMGIYQITSNWNEHAVTWNTKPSTASSALDTADLYANGVNEDNPEYVTYYVTSYVNSWYSGTPNYGFALKRTGGTNSSILLVSRDKINKYAQLYINYEQRDLGQGIYAVSNSNTNKYLKSYINDPGLSWLLQDTSHTTAPVSAADLENLFKFCYRPQYDDYIIRSMIDNSLVIFPSIENNSPVAGRMSQSNDELSKAYGWEIIPRFPYYYIAYTSGGVTYYAKSVSDNHDAAIRFTTDPDDNSAKWYFTHYTGNAIETVAAEKMKTSMYVYDDFQYRVRMRSTQINCNGPVRYSVVDEDGSGTDKAIINATTGELHAQKPGTIHLEVTFAGAPYIWYWKVSIRVLPCSGYEIPYAPSSWNNAANIRKNSNCYNYALNKQNTVDSGVYYFMQPGNAAGVTPFAYTFNTDSNGIMHIYATIKDGDSIAANAMADAAYFEIYFEPIGRDEVCPEGTYKIALVVDLNDDPDYQNSIDADPRDPRVLVESADTDYHWYRQNPDGTWSHKRGGTMVTNLDASDDVIYDPQFCDRTYGGYDYTVFVGYFAVSALG